ncbi:MAG: RnfABCDGE type electron transport complex subunit D [Xanthomonadales bacterium]|nr:RnfABCDGE type electron transport complex subunit D [Xanthomonadales bacterium]
MEFSRSGAPHLPPENTVSKVMLQVILALIPGILAMVWFFGVGVLIQIALSILFAVLLEWAMLKLRGKPIRPFLSDYSAVVTAILFALCIPPLAPWWISLVGMIAAIVVAKHLYGGLGQNIFNPAMVAYVVVLIAFPLELTRWLAPRGLIDVELLPGLLQSLQTIISGLPANLSWDAITQATPLDLLKDGVEQNQMISEIRQAPVFGNYGGRGWEWIANFFALGGIWLIWRRVISWHIPVAIIASVIMITLPAWLYDPSSNPIPLQHIFSGALVLCAFFIATDPVTGCASRRGKIIFGLGVAILTLTIRLWGGYPDGVAFAVLLMNMFAPLIDRYTRPRAYGKPR